MVRTLATRLAVAAALVGALAACGDEVPADEAPAASVVEPGTAAILKERHDNFESIGDAFKAVRGELEKDAPDFALIADNANDIYNRAGNIERHFIERTSIDDGFDTEALATIWEKPDGFKAATQKLLDESAELAAVAASGDKAAVAAQAMAMGGACKDCHDQFRLDDEK
ncbi:cytochrome c [Erythrobacter sp.]|jgi:cytochrome c556|uniref:c-type cytochrome n=1 Tax=Erythrobacter sp. TaxID=1042 RepID=UPI0025E3B65A|nr:cytochrome c [Erythrobacter sp.]